MEPKLLSIIGNRKQIQQKLDIILVLKELTVYMEEGIRQTHPGLLGVKFHGMPCRQFAAGQPGWFSHTELLSPSVKVLGSHPLYCELSTPPYSSK